MVSPTSFKVQHHREYNVYLSAVDGSIHIYKHDSKWQIKYYGPSVPAEACESDEAFTKYVDQCIAELEANIP